MSKKKIAFFNPPDLIWGDVPFMKANPGIGGTEYVTAVLIESLKNDGRFDVCLFSTVPKAKINGYTVSLCSNLQEAICAFSDYENDVIFILIIRNEDDVPKNIPKNVKVISWVHCEYGKQLKKILSRRKDIFHVFLTAESRALYARYKNIWNNSSVIGNFTSVPARQPIDAGERDLTVSYVGALMGFKHVDVLTRAWPEVVKKVPNARLNVIGSAHLYGKLGQLGKRGIAWENYEREILYPLIKHHCLETVTFAGLVSPVSDYITSSRTAVGVVNPIGTTETFCISAIEFGALGIPVIGGDRGGLRNTLPKGCGYRVKSSRQLSKKIIFLLKNPAIRSEMGSRYFNFVKSNYSLNDFQKNWSSFLCRNAFSKALRKGRFFRIVSSAFVETRLFICRCWHYVWRARILSK